MCYRTDLFKKAGLPTDRDEVSALWPTWDDYIKTGKKFKAGNGERRRHFIDAATNTYNTILMQKAGHGAGYTYFDKRATTWSSTPTRRSRAPGTPRSRCIDAGLSAKLQSWTHGVERRLQERHVRHHRLPGLDDRLHQGAGRRRRQGQVGHRRGARRRRQLGRLVPRRAEAEQAPRRRSSWSSS